MAKYMLISDAFIDGVLHQATQERPKFVELPDAYLPSLTWMPLDKSAQEAQIKLARAKDPSGDLVKRVMKIPGTVNPVLVEKLDVEVKKPVTTEDLAAAAFKRAQDAATKAALTAGVQGARPSDSEPR